MVSVFFPASVHPSLHLSEHCWCFRERPTGTLRSFIQRVIESPALSMNAGVIFLLCVACCFILLHFTPLLSPISQPSCGPWRPCWLGTPWGLQGPRSAEGMRRGCEGDAEASGADTPPPCAGLPYQQVPWRSPSLQMQQFGMPCYQPCLLTLSPLHCYGPLSPWVPSPLLLPGLCQAMSLGAFCFSQCCWFAACPQHG